MDSMRSFVLAFKKKEQITHDVFSFYFDRSSSSFAFTAGQYIRIILPHKHADDRGTTRFFTIASSPLDYDLMITTKIVQSTFKDALFSLSPGQEVQFWGPFGNFVLEEGQDKETVCIAGGIGITPFHSMITYAAAKKLAVPITLLVSFRTYKDLVFYDKLREIAGTNSNIRVVYTLTAPRNSDGSWRGETGRIDDLFIKKYIYHYNNCMFYLSGSLTMVNATDAALQQLAVPAEQIITDIFSGY